MVEMFRGGVRLTRLRWKRRGGSCKRPPRGEDGRYTNSFWVSFLFATICLILATSLHAQDAVTTLAGQPLVSGAANGTGTNALFSDPAAMVADTNGNMFVADSRNDAIRKITTNGVVTTFAGQLGVPGTANATGTNAQFNTPSGLAFDAGGNLLVSDTGNNTLRKITPAGAVSLFAGVAGAGGFADGATGSALFTSPLGIAVAANGSVFVADSGNHCVREISGGTVTTFAGSPQIWGSVDATGTNAQFDGPIGLAFDTDGNLFVSDANNDTLREITTNGVVTTYAGQAGVDGSTDGSLRSARFRSPAEMVFDPKGNLFVADSFNQTVREITPDGVVSTVSGVPGISGTNDGVNGLGKFFNPYGLAVAVDGSLLVADTYNETVRMVLVPFKLSAPAAGAAGGRTLSWDTVIGKTYQAQFKDVLTAVWTNLGPPVQATGLTVTVTDPSAAASRYYRVLRVE